MGPALRLGGSDASCDPGHQCGRFVAVGASRRGNDLLVRAHHRDLCAVSTATLPLIELVHRFVVHVSSLKRRAGAAPCPSGKSLVNLFASREVIAGVHAV